MQNPLSGQEFGKYKYDFGKVMPATVQTPQGHHKPVGLQGRGQISR